ncbi:MAG: hypothetical protein ACLFU2_00705, partial [Opitutales bacterium]
MKRASFVLFSVLSFFSAASLLWGAKPAETLLWEAVAEWKEAEAIDEVTSRRARAELHHIEKAVKLVDEAAATGKGSNWIACQYIRAMLHMALAERIEDAHYSDRINGLPEKWKTRRETALITAKEAIAASAALLAQPSQRFHPFSQDDADYLRKTFVGFLDWFSEGAYEERPEIQFLASTGLHDTFTLMTRFEEAVYNFEGRRQETIEHLLRTVALAREREDAERERAFLDLLLKLDFPMDDLEEVADGFANRRHLKELQAALDLGMKRFVHPTWPYQAILLVDELEPDQDPWTREMTMRKLPYLDKMLDSPSWEEFAARARLNIAFFRFQRGVGYGNRILDLLGEQPDNWPSWYVHIAREDFLSVLEGPSPDPDLALPARKNLSLIALQEFAFLDREKRLWIVPEDPVSEENLTPDARGILSAILPHLPEIEKSDPNDLNALTLLHL